MSQFNNLLKDLEGLTAEQETMTKALPADDGKDDEKIQAAAEEGGDMDAEKKTDCDEGDEDDEKPMAKSFTLKLEDGTEVEAQDGTELVKSLMEKVDATEGQMAKALGSAVGLIKSQGEMLKALSEQVKKLSGEGRGRKTVLSVTEKKTASETLAKSEGSDGMTPQEFMLKSNSAFTGGKISGKELTVIDVSLRSGVAIDPTLISKVMA